MLQQTSEGCDATQISSCGGIHSKMYSHPLRFTLLTLYLATSAKSIILDSEVLLMDTQRRRPLPFGTLGVHKKTAFKDATVCLFVFDVS